MSRGNIRLFLVIGIIVLMGLSWYTLMNESYEMEKRYNDILETARFKRDNYMHEDSFKLYFEALDMRESLELRKEIAEFYKETGNKKKYVEFYDNIIEKYPYEKTVYENLATYFNEMKDYKSCFSIINSSKRRGVMSDVISEIEELIKYKYEVTHVAFEDVKIFSQNYCPVKKDGDFWGYCDPYGQVVIPFKYEIAKQFTASGYAPVKDQNGMMYLIDLYGTIKSTDAQKRKIEDITNVISSKMAIKIDGKYTYCDVNFNDLFGNFDYASAFYSGVAAVMDNGKWSIIEETGKRISDTEYEDVKMDEYGVAFYNNVGFVKKDGKYYLIDNKGNNVSNEFWDDVDAFNSSGPAAVKKDEKWGFIDISGNIVLDYKYDDAKSFSNGFAAVKKKDKWGYINLEKYAEIIDFSYDDANDFNANGSAFVYINDAWSLIKIYSLNR